jgi:hypothetical protein
MLKREKSIVVGPQRISKKIKMCFENYKSPYFHTSNKINSPFNIFCFPVATHGHLTSNSKRLHFGKTGPEPSMTSITLRSCPFGKNIIGLVAS